MITHNEKKMLTAAYRYSYTRFALNFYGYFEAAIDEKKIPTEFVQYEKELLDILACFLEGRNESFRLEELRKAVSDGMEKLTSYVECFQIFEYIFNRLERKFCTVKMDLPTQKELLSEIEEFFSESEDSMILNSRVQSLIRETPIRFTKSKFFTMVKESLLVYAGSPKKNMESFLERLRFYSRLQLPDINMDGCEGFSDTLSKLAGVDYKNLTSELYSATFDEISRSMLAIIDYSDKFLLLQELINDLLVLLISKDSVMIEMGDEAVVSGIVTDVLDLFSNGVKEMPEEITDCLEFLEGKQETYFEKYSSIANDKQMDELVWRVDRLLSSSPFASLEREDEGSEEDKSDEAWIGARVDDFCEELAEVFANQHKFVVRAIMAQVLSNLPMWFHSMAEILQYIESGLDACTDINEKESSIELMVKIMETEYALV